MSDPLIWADVQIEVGATRGTALTLDTISKANPAVCHYTSGTDPANGTYMVFDDTVGMVELRNRVFRIAGVDGAANTFQLEGEDSTDYHTFVSGTAKPVATFASMTTVQDVNASGGEPDYADVSVIHNSLKRRIPTTFSPASYSFGCLFDAADPAMLRLRALTKRRTPEAIVFIFADGTAFAFYAFAAASGAPTGSAGDPVKTNVSLESQGLPNVYAAA